MKKLLTLTAVAEAATGVALAAQTADSHPILPALPAARSGAATPLLWLG